MSYRPLAAKLNPPQQRLYALQIADLNKSSSDNMAAIVDSSAAADFAMPCTCERCAPQTADLRPPTQDERRHFLGTACEPPAAADPPPYSCYIC